MSELRIVFTKSQAAIDAELTEAIDTGNVNPVISPCAVIIPDPRSGLSITEIMAKDVPSDSPHVRIITTDEIPQDRMFRDAWDDSNRENFIGTNLVKAQVIAHNIRRIDREVKLSPLDKEEGYASTTQSRKDAILAEKNNILSENSTLQTDIDKTKTESSLRKKLKDAGII